MYDGYSEKVLDYLNYRIPLMNEVINEGRLFKYSRTFAFINGIISYEIYRVMQQPVVQMGSYG